MLTYAAARDTLVAELRANAADHDAARYDAIGRRFDRVEHDFPTGTAPELARLHIALTFWTAGSTRGTMGGRAVRSASRIGPFSRGGWRTISRKTATCRTRSCCRASTSSRIRGSTSECRRWPRGCAIGTCDDEALGWGA